MNSKLHAFFGRFIKPLKQKRLSEKAGDQGRPLLLGGTNWVRDATAGTKTAHCGAPD